MGLFTSAVFIVSVICSWAVIDVLACENNNMSIFVCANNPIVYQNLKTGSREELRLIRSPKTQEALDSNHTLKEDLASQQVNHPMSRVYVLKFF